MGKKQINLGLFTSVYSYFLYLLLKGYDENDIIIVHNTFPEEISKNINPIIVPVEATKYGGLKQSIETLGIKQMIKGFTTYVYNYLKLRMLLFIKTFNKDVENYGHPFSGYAFMFYENENSNIIEDGLANYTQPICETHKINPIIDTLLHIGGIYFLNNCETYGTHKNIKNIYLTKNFDHPLIKDKIKVIDPEKMWNELDYEEKNQILDIFNMNNINIDFKENTALILTQPLFQDGLMTLERELNIYKEIMEKLSDYKILIKPHPRDKKDYKKIFPDAEIIDSSFPIELLNLIDINPSIVSSIYTAALLNFKNCKIYIYEGELYDKKLNDARDELLKRVHEENAKNLINEISQ